MARMTAKQKRIEFLRKEITSQQAWMKQCGGSLHGYVERYGSAGNPEHSGDGGEAIYAADFGQLKKLEGQLGELTRA